MTKSHRVAALLAAAALLVLAPGAAAAKQPPKRFVALTPFAANTLAALDIRPVGIGQTIGGNDRLSRKLRGVRRLPLSHPNGPNLEQLASLQPDMVLSSPTWRKGHATIRSLDIDVKEIDARSIAAMRGEIVSMGRIVGRTGRARRLAAKVAADVSRARRKVKRRPRVLLILGVGRTPFAFLPNSWGGDVVTKSGGRLLSAGLRARDGFKRISDETVVAQDPDVIIAVPHAAPKDVKPIARYLKSNPAWQTTKAVRNGRVYVSTDNSLLQAGTDVAATIRKVRAKYLKNR